MGYAYTIDEALNLLVVRLWGEMPYAEEAQVVSETLDDKRIKPDPTILVDRREAKMSSTPGQVGAHVDLVGRKLQTLGQPKVANVVSTESDYGMIRMFEARAEDRIRHRFGVFRSLEEACAWLEIDCATVKIPER